MKQYLRLLKYLKPYIHVIIITWIFSILVICFQAVTVWVGAAFVHKVVYGLPVATTKSDISFIVNFMDAISNKVLLQDSPFKSLISGAIVLFGTGLATGILRLAKLYILGVVNQSIILKIRNELFSEILKRDLVFSKLFNSGEIASLFIRDVDQLNMALIDAVDRIFLQPLRLIIIIILMLSLSVDLTLIVVCFLAGGGITVYIAGNRMERLWKKFLEKISHTQGFLTEFLSLVTLSRSLGREKDEKIYYYKICSDLKNLKISQMVTQMFTPELVKLLLLFSGSLIFVIGGHRVFIQKSMSGDALIKLVLLLPLATYPMEALASLYTSIKTSLASVKRIFAFMDDKTLILKLNGKQIIDKFNHTIHLSNIVLSFDNKLILNNVSLSVKKGSITIITGPTGTGKTTLLGIIAGFITPQSGQILIDNLEINKIDNHSWLKRLGIVTQDPMLLNRTIRENLLYADPSADDNRLIDVMKQSLLWDEISVFPQGLDTPVGNRGELLSGGEKQRLTIARAILKNPDIIIMDEPTSMLDYNSKEKILNTVSSLSKKYTLIIVTHDHDLMKLADTLYELDNGNISIKLKK
ncbi:MAG: ABC transporter ATP-binding protein [Spirochaetes bacterium]|nr:ABC transporter ATP-binding protein [Spirochaetota bacterium]MBN2770138.1 ABC transporter ATP-binding protein [Spirochaetota bacterium]